MCFRVGLEYRFVMVMLVLWLLPCLVLGEHVFDENDYYARLRVSSEADDQEIKRAYRKLSLKYHPDKNGGDQEAFRKVALAYEVLSDPVKRNAYDRDGEEGVEALNKQSQQQQHGGMFGGFFNGFGQQQGPQKRPNLVIPLLTTLENIYSGQELNFSVYRQSKCRKCRGTGAYSKKDIKPCGDCGGRGVIVRMHEVYPGMYQQIQQQCPSCSGKGKKVGKKCPFCAGSRVSEVRNQLRVVIEKGTPDDHTITFNHAADESPEEASGDIVYRVQALPHATFVRSGNDLLLTVYLSLKESLLGFARVVKHLDGRDVKIERTDRVTAPQSKEKIKGHGMPVFADPGNFGDLIVTYEVEFPASLTDAQKASLKSIEM